VPETPRQQATLTPRPPSHPHHARSLQSRIHSLHLRLRPARRNLSVVFRIAWRGTALDQQRVIHVRQNAKNGVAKNGVEKCEKWGRTPNSTYYSTVSNTLFIRITQCVRQCVSPNHCLMIAVDYAELNLFRLSGKEACVQLCRQECNTERVMIP
jgi:hypothetical protein